METKGVQYLCCAALPFSVTHVEIQEVLDTKLSKGYTALAQPFLPLYFGPVAPIQHTDLEMLCHRLRREMPRISYVGAMEAVLEQLVCWKIEEVPEWRELHQMSRSFFERFIAKSYVEPPRKRGWSGTPDQEVAIQKSGFPWWDNFAPHLIIAARSQAGIDQPIGYARYSMHWDRVVVAGCSANGILNNVITIA